MKKLLETIMDYYDLEKQKTQKEIEELKKEHGEKIQNLKEQHKMEVELNVEKALRIRNYKGYQNLSDFCRVTKDFFFFKENELKQYLLSKHVLKREESSGKYIPANDKATLVDNELYIDYEWLRTQLVFVRTMLYFDKDLYEREAENFFRNKGEEVNNIANTVLVECKQRSKEFREHRENKHFIENNEHKEVIK